MTAKHFAGLDGLRFVSITFVVLHHLFTFKTNFGFGVFDYPVLGLIGLYGIHFFFMGSGFLITYLLLSEEAQYGRISLKKFFLRRILRIWPAYYLLIVIVLIFLVKSHFFLIPGVTDAYLNSSYRKSNLLYYFFLPHLQPFFYPTGPYIHHTYTIGIEEQFYILWGLLFALLRKRIYIFFVILLVLYPLLNFMHYWFTSHYKAKDLHPFLNYFNSLVTYIKYSRLSTFAIGSLFGWAYFHQSKWIFYFKKKSLQLILYIVLIGSITIGFFVPVVQDEYMAFLMACLMLVGTFKKESLINYSAKWLSYLGKISYGIYLFHIIAIVLAAKTVSYLFGSQETFFTMSLLIIITLSLSILFGHLSYHYFENIFLKLKRRFRNVSTAHE